MLKARNKKLSMILVLAMLMTMFAGLGVASAAGVSYSVEKATDVQIGPSKDLGIIMVKVPEASIVKGEFISVSLPEGLTFNVTPTHVGNNVYMNLGNSFVNMLDPVFDFDADTTYPPNITKDKRTLNLKVSAKASQTGEATFQIFLNDINVQDAAGDISILVGGPKGSLFHQAPLTFGKTVSKGSTTTLIKSVKNFGDGGGTLDTLIIMENMAGTLKNGDQIKLRLPNGFTWNNAGTIKGDWGLVNAVSYNTTPATGERDLIVELAITSSSSGTAGRITIDNLGIDVEDNGKTGDITVTVSSIKGDITTEDVVVAKYGSYDVTVAEDTVKDLLAGKSDRELGGFVIEEVIAGSLINGRTITLELPKGVKWEKGPDITPRKGSDLIGTWTIVNGSKGRTIKATVTGSTGTPSKMLLEKGKVYIEPGFEGPIEIKVDGTAGVEGTVKVAEVKKAVEISAEGVKNIIIGSQNQKVADVLIKENAKEAILRATNQDEIVLTLDSGFTFFKAPTVEVIEGDLEIDSTSLNSAKTELTLKIKYNSSKPSTIKVSDVYVTGFRHAPEGPVKLILKEAEGKVATSGATGSTALDAGYANGAWADNELSEVSAGEVVIANCVTPAQGGGVAEFKVGSNIYYVGGVAKVMDVAPYIKGDRSYVPMRYLAEMLGAEVVWDDAARTVTLTKGDDVVVFTIGSTSYTVNGEAMTADVAPEIVNERTMLPARFVAEAFGAVVGWDAGTQTVLVQQ